MGLSSLSTTASPLSAMVPASSLVAQSGVIVVLGPSTALATLVLTTELEIRSRRTGLRGNGGRIADVGLTSLCLMEVASLASATPTVRLSSAAPSGATAGATKNTAGAQSVSTMLSEKSRFGLFADFVEIYLNCLSVWFFVYSNYSLIDSDDFGFTNCL